MLVFLHRNLFISLHPASGGGEDQVKYIFFLSKSVVTDFILETHNFGYHIRLEAR